MGEICFARLESSVEEMFIGPFGSSLKNDSFVAENEAFCIVYEQKHAIQKTMDVDTRYINKEKYEELKRFDVRGGDILVSCRGTIGETFIVPDDATLGIMHPSIMKIRLKQGIYDKQYFNLLLVDYLKRCEVHANGSGVKMAISAKELGKVLFPLPSMFEQRHIAAVLDKVSELIALRKQQLTKLDELVKARFVEMFGDTPDKEKKTMADICKIITDGTHQPPKFTSTGIPFLFVSNIVTNEICYDAEKFISEETYAELIKRTPIAIGDILLSTVGSYGHPAVVKSDKPFCFQRHIAYLKPNADMVNSEYLRGAILSADVQRQIDERVKGIAQKTLNLSEIRKLRLPLPPLPAQEQFAAIVEQTDKSKLAVQQGLDKLETLKKALMQEYFGGYKYG